jgi:hypothetical protein
VKWQPREWEKTGANDTSDRGSIYVLYKESYNSIVKIKPNLKIS